MAPSRRTVACTATDRRSASTAFWARTSWTKSIVMLIVTMVTTMAKLATSPVAADNPLATSRMITKGLRKRERNCTHSGDGLTTAASLGPKVVSRDWTSAAARPAALVERRVRIRSTGSFQISSAPSSLIAGLIVPSFKGSRSGPAGQDEQLSNLRLAHHPDNRATAFRSDTREALGPHRSTLAQRSDRLLRRDPSCDLRPMIFQRAGSHEQPDMAPRHGLLHDPVLCSSDVLCGIKDLLHCCNVIVGPRQQVDGALDIVQIELAAETDEFAFGKTVLLENLGNHLEIPASRQVNRIFVPALERLFLCKIGRVVDVLIEIDVILNVVLPGVHVLPALQHELAHHHATAERDQFLVERGGRLLDHAFDRPVSGVRIDR